MNWKKLTSINELPKNKSFLLWDEKITSGLRVYEAMVFDGGTLGCPATCDDYNIKDFSHWCEIESPHVCGRDVEPLTKEIDSKTKEVSLGIAEIIARFL